MIQQMKNNLQTLESNVDNVVKTAEMLGAAHQVLHITKTNQKSLTSKSVSMCCLCVVYVLRASGGASQSCGGADVCTPGASAETPRYRE